MECENYVRNLNLIINMENIIYKVKLEWYQVGKSQFLSNLKKVHLSFTIFQARIHAQRSYQAELMDAFPWLECGETLDS